MLNENKLLEVPHYDGEEGIQRHREIMLEWIYPIRFTNLQPNCVSPEKTQKIVPPPRR